VVDGEKEKLNNILKIVFCYFIYLTPLSTLLGVEKK
jgi:hypothetical protein